MTDGFNIEVPLTQRPSYDILTPVIRENCRITPSGKIIPSTQIDRAQMEAIKEAILKHCEENPDE